MEVGAKGESGQRSAEAREQEAPATKQAIWCGCGVQRKAHRLLLRLLGGVSSLLGLGALGLQRRKREGVVFSPQA